MTRIEDAIRRAQTEQSVRASTAERAVVGARRPADPQPSSSDLAADEGRRKVSRPPTHHVDRDSLVASGLLVPPDHPGLADEFRRIKRPLIDNATSRSGTTSDHMNVIMIASSLPRAGKTFCAVNLAASVALERELNVLLVDADVSKPQISREFGLAESRGLIDLLQHDSLDLAEMLVRTDLNNIQVLPAGSRHPQATELLASERMSQIVGELATRYSDRIIILDSPPLMITSEAQALAGQVGQIVLVVEAGQTTHKQLTETLQVLGTDKPVNLLLNKGRSRGRGKYYYGGAYGH